MTSPLRLRLEAEIPKELRLALSEEPGELPSEEALGALRARLAEQVGPAVRLRARVPLERSTLQTALRDDPSEFPSDEQLRVLSRRVELKRSPVRPARSKRRIRATAVAVCVLIAGVAAAASYWVSRHRERSVPPILSASPSIRRATLRAPAVEPAAGSASVEPAVSAAPSTRASSNPARAKALPTVLEPGPTELELLREAHRLQASDPAAALRVVARHLRLFPSGVLAQERELVAIDALLRVGQREAARVRAATFLRQYPGSVHALRIQELVGGSDPSNSARAVEQERAPDGGARIFSP